MEATGGAYMSPRTPTEREQLRKSQYKSGGGSTTPDWKTSYRKRCVERLKQSRERLISRFRQIETSSESIQQEGGESSGCMNRSSDSRMEEDPVTASVKEMMNEEWERMRAENSDLPQISCRNRTNTLFDPAGINSYRWQLSSNPTFSSNEEEYESEDVNYRYVMSIIDDLTQELILEEQTMLAQYQERLRIDEENSLSAAIDSFEATSNGLICPICKQNYLFQDVRSIYCACGLQINTIHDGLSLEYLQQQLETCVTQHRTLCCGKPNFSLECNVGIQNLIMNCTLCDFMYIVL